MTYNIGVANFIRTRFSTWQWSDLHVIVLKHHYKLTWASSYYIIKWVAIFS